MKFTVLFLLAVGSLFFAGCAEVTFSFENASLPFAIRDSVPVHWRWLQPLPDKQVQFRNGRGQLGSGHGGYLRMDRVERVALTGGRNPEWLVFTTYGTGGTATWQYVYFVQATPNSPKVLAILESGSRGSGGILKTAVHDRRLTIDFLDPQRTEGDCCSSGVISVDYQWDGHEFVEASPRRPYDLPVERNADSEH